MIESALDEALMAQDELFHPLVSLITYVVVDKVDPAFKSPSKPIGPCFSKTQAKALPYPTIKTPKGFRRVVASPKPITIIEKREIKRLINAGFIVICCGGGGIPVIRKGRAFNGVDAVIDKDLASALLAVEVGAELLIMATDVAGVFRHFKTNQETLIPHLSLSEAKGLLGQSRIGKGSMEPKLKAAVYFLERGGSRAVITKVDAIDAGVNGLAGTQIADVDSP